MKDDGCNELNPLISYPFEPLTKFVVHKYIIMPVFTPDTFFYAAT